MANGFLRRSMSYFGLVDDEFEDAGQPAFGDSPDPALGSGDQGAEAGRISASPVAIAPIAHEPSSNVTLFAPRGTRPRSTELSPQVQTVAPMEFADAKRVADNVLASRPVILNLQTTSRELKRRMIDFCSGVTYALGGGMERVAKNVLLITPSNVELSADERERALMELLGELSDPPDAQAL